MQHITVQSEVIVHLNFTSILLDEGKTSFYNSKAGQTESNLSINFTE